MPLEGISGKTILLLFGDAKTSILRIKNKAREKTWNIIVVKLFSFNIKQVLLIFSTSV